MEGDQHGRQNFASVWPVPVHCPADLSVLLVSVLRARGRQGWWWRNHRRHARVALVYPGTRIAPWHFSRPLHAPSRRVILLAASAENQFWAEA